jgi:hypothetical protein
MSTKTITKTVSKTATPAAAPVAAPLAPAVSAEPEENECTICMDFIKCKGKINSCTHTFCFDCISKFISGVMAS